MWMAVTAAGREGSEDYCLFTVHCNVLSGHDCTDLTIKSFYTIAKHVI